MRVLRTVGGVQQARCVPRYVTWNWFFNRRPGSRGWR